MSDGRVCGIMEVSRSIGDVALKSKGVSSVPETTRIALTQVEHTLASDREAFRLRIFIPWRCQVAHIRLLFMI